MSDTVSDNVLCDFDGCSERAVVSYAWAWGEEGHCCARHQVVVRQKSKSLNRDVVFASLNVGPTPMTRDERIQATARSLTLEAELEEAKTRGMELYRAHQQLQQQAHTLSLQKAELEAQLADARAQLDELREANGVLRVQASEENAELQRLRALLPAPSPVVDATP